MANFTIPYTTPSNYQYDSDKIEINSGLAKLKNLTPVDENFYANYNTNINGSRGLGVLTGNPYGGASVSGGKLDLTGSTLQYVTYSANNNANMQQQGCIRFKFTPNYITATGESVPFCIRKQYNNTVNLIYYRDTGSHHRFHIYDSTGSLIVECYFDYKQWAIGQEYELEFNFDITNGDCRMFIDGVQQGSTKTGIGVRDSNIGTLQLGSNYKNATTSNFKIDDFQVFSTVQHTANYIPIAIPENAYVDDSPTIYKTLGDSIANIEEWINFLETLGIENEGLVRYQLSEDAITWKYWNGSIWTTAGASDYNTFTDINSNINTFLAVANKIFAKAFLISNGTQKVELDLNTIGYVINTDPLVYAGTDKDIIVNVSMKPFNDSLLSDAEGNIVKAEWKEDGGVYAEIPQGTYSTLSEAVQDFDYTPVTSGDMNLFLKITDSFDAISEDNLSLHTTHVVIDVTIKDVNGNHLSNVTFDQGDGTGSSIKDSPFSLTAHIGTYTSVLSKTYFDTLSETNTISISTTGIAYVMERETRIDELVCHIDAPRKFTKGDTLSFNGVIDINLNNYKIRCEITDADDRKIKLATSNSGGLDSEINIFNSASGNFIINVAKDLTTLFADIVYIEIEIENTSGQIRTVFKERVKFEDQNLTWTEPS